jgi:hypothetical protein
MLRRHPELAPITYTRHNDVNTGSRRWLTVHAWTPGALGGAERCSACHDISRRARGLQAGGWLAGSLITFPVLERPRLRSAAPTPPPPPSPPPPIDLVAVLPDSRLVRLVLRPGVLPPACSLLAFCILPGVPPEPAGDAPAEEAAAAEPDSSVPSASSSESVDDKVSPGAWPPSCSSGSGFTLAAGCQSGTRDFTPSHPWTHSHPFPVSTKVWPPSEMRSVRASKVPG